MKNIRASSDLAEKIYTHRDKKDVSKHYLSSLKDAVKFYKKDVKRSIKRIRNFDPEKLLKLRCSYDPVARGVIVFEKYLVSSAGIEILDESKNITNDEKAVLKISSDLKKLI